jgi:hypothetical protein
MATSIESLTSDGFEPRIGYNTLMATQNRRLGTVGGANSGYGNMIGATGNVAAPAAVQSNDGNSGGYLDYLDSNDYFGTLGNGYSNTYSNTYTNNGGLSRRKHLRRRNGLLNAAGSGVVGRVGNQLKTAAATTGLGMLGLGSSGYGGGSSGYGGGGQSGYGGGSGYGGSPVSVVSGYGPSQQCESGINPLLALLTLAGAAIGFYYIFIKLTMSTGRRNFGNSATMFESIADMTWIGQTTFHCLSNTLLSLSRKKREIERKRERADCHQFSYNINPFQLQTSAF